MKNMFAVVAFSVLAGFFAGRITAPEDRAYAQAQTPAPAQSPTQPMVGNINQPQPPPDALPYGFNRQGNPLQAPDASPTTFWSIADIRKTHAELADRAAKNPTQMGL